MTGNVRYNEYQDKLELMVSSVGISDSTPRKSASKKKEEIPEVPQEVLKDEDIEVEEIALDE